MTRTTIATICLALLPAIARADKLVLSDGSQVAGRIRRRTGDRIELTTPEGLPRSIPRERVETILSADDLAEQFARRREKIADASDTQALVALADWARETALEAQAKQLLEDVLDEEPDHPVARRGLGFVRVDGRWRSFRAAVHLALQRFEQTRWAPDEIESLAEQISRTAYTVEEQLDAAEVRGRLHLRRRELDAARDEFASAAKLARRADLTDRAFRFETMDDLLRDNPDGMYILEEAYPPESILLGAGESVLPAGPVSLSHPLGLSAALQDAARRETSAAEALIAEALEAEQIDPDRARAKYIRAELALNRADVLVPQIGHTYRVEIARRQIMAVRRDVEVEARSYDDQEERLGARDLSDEDYRELIERMIHHLDGVENGLKEILRIARPYPRELILEVQWAKTDLQAIRRKRKILREEIHDG